MLLNNGKKGLAIPIVLCVILCLGIYVVSMSWSMSTARNRYTKTLNNRKAYFMARSCVEHLLLKIKVMQSRCWDSMLALETKNEEDKVLYNSVFKEDILVPPDNNYTGEKFEYRLNEFSVDSVDLENSRITINIDVTGKYGANKNGIKRLMCVSR